MTVIRKNRCGNTELEKRAHTSVQEKRNKQNKIEKYKIKNQDIRNKIDKSKQMKNSRKTKNRIHKLKNKIHKLYKTKELTVDLVFSKKKKLLCINKKRKYKQNKYLLVTTVR